MGKETRLLPIEISGYATGWGGILASLHTVGHLTFLL